MLRSTRGLGRLGSAVAQRRLIALSARKCRALEVSPTPETARLIPYEALPRSAQAAGRSGDLSYVLDGSPKGIDTFWLRDSCQCAQCVDIHSGQRKFSSHEIPVEIACKTATQMPSGDIEVTWAQDAPGFGSDHVSTYSHSLFASSTANAKYAQRRLPVRWNRSMMENRFRTYDYHRYMDADDSVFRDVLIELHKTGLVFFDNVPPSEESVEHIGERIGPLRNSFYGRTWDVKDVPRATNVASTATHLGMHMDLLYMKNPPAIQLLHCINSSAEGGESMFIDSFDIAASIYNESPADFKSLTEFPVTYHYRKKDGQIFEDSKPTVELNKAMNDAAVSGPASLEPIETMIENVNWSPPFQGHFPASFGLPDYGVKLRQYQRAASLFGRDADDERLQFRHRLEPGQCVMFNNRRILHGRTQFQPGRQERWLKGTYLDSDDFNARINAIEPEHFPSS